MIFGPPGYAYVYFVYGMYHCLNFVTEPDGEAGAVLIRALEPVTGVDAMRLRRPKARRLQDVASGPGKLAQALGVTLDQYGVDVTQGSLTVREDVGSDEIQVELSPRIGITKAADLPLRFFVKGNAHLSRG